MEHIISSVAPGSIAQEMGIEPGDRLLEVNGKSPEDVFDYRYLMNEEEILVLIRKVNGEEWELEIEKEYEDDLGIEFENGLMDDYRSCRNKCIFCFIDQLPKGMRSTLYFKDDDSRLSFLQGNYLTLTNMSEHDIDRIIQYKLSPINISFQTMNPELRCKMLHNRFAGEIFDKVKRLKDAGIIMNGQIVLCRGVNDGAELERSIRELTAYMPQLESVSVVPVGLTRYRDGLYPLEPFTKEDACEVLDLIHGWQEKLYKEWGNHFIHAGDEWYILAERPIPEEKTYDGYLQLENGVGMVRLLEEEVAQTLAGMTGDDRKIHRTIATGELAAPFLRKHVESVRKKYPNVDIQVLAIKNEFFGGKITVAGLITGTDLLSQLKGKDLGDRLLLTNHMLKSGEPVFLDDVTVDDVQNALQIKVSIVESSGADFVSSLIED
jgi:putative radical SAM enzyme (TIGR03279 family)